MRKQTFNIMVIGILAMSIYLCGCAHHKPIIQEAIPKIDQTAKMTGIYHKVETGQTLWSISKKYNIDVNEIVKVNRLPNSARIEKGQLIFIPNTTTKTLLINPQGSPENVKFIWPARGEIISFFGNVNSEKINRGIDIRAAQNTNVTSAKAGRVVFCDLIKGYGQTIIINHLDGLSSIYSSNFKPAVKLGDAVTQGQIIAQNTNSVIHFEIRQGHRAQNPLLFLP